MGCRFLCPPVWQKYPVILTTVWPQLQWHLPPFPQCHLIRSSHPSFSLQEHWEGFTFEERSCQKENGESPGWAVFSPCWNESAVPPLHTLQPVVFFYACQACFLMWAIITPKERIGIWYDQSFSKHLLCGKQPRNGKWVLCPQRTYHIRGEINHVNKLGSFWGIRT